MCLFDSNSLSFLIFDYKTETFKNFIVCVDDLPGSLLLLESESGLSEKPHQRSSVFESFSHIFKSSAICGEGGFIPGEGGHGDFGRG